MNPITQVRVCECVFVTKSTTQKKKFPTQTVKLKKKKPTNFTYILALSLSLEH